jgi:hypothetical protein
VTANIDEVIGWSCAVVPSDNAAVVGSVLVGLLEMQEIEDIAGSERDVILEFCQEQTDFLARLSSGYPEEIRPIVDVFWKVCRERSTLE